MEEFLITDNKVDSCLSCTNQTNFISKCCKKPICAGCFCKWLETKRQCMHCRADQMEEDIWIEKYRKEDPEHDQQIIQEQIQSFMQDIMQDISQLYTQQVPLTGPGVVRVDQPFMGGFNTPLGTVSFMAQPVPGPRDVDIWTAIKESMDNPQGW